jgi:endonuclease/exonuclease/phosphatase family metal-dependent hydrolase
VQPAVEAGDPDLTVLSFNIHYLAPGQKRLDWASRRDAVVLVLREADADIIAFQEMETFSGGHYNPENRQRDWVAAHLPQYAAAATGDPAVFPNTQPVFYRSERFQALEQGFFFFSPRPQEIYSRPWAGRYPAFCSWVRLRERASGRSFYVFNLHLDHGSLRNRLMSARLVAERIRERGRAEEPALVVGDFNAPALFRPVQIVRRAGMRVAPPRGSTFHHYRGLHLLPAIDHLLFTPPFFHLRTGVLRGRYDGVWPSDHYPVLFGLRWSAGAPGLRSACGSTASAPASR